MPLYAMVSASVTGVPSTVSAAPPNAWTRRPVAVTMMSASRVRPDSRSSPVSVNVVIRSVTTEAVPERMAANRSPSGGDAQPLVPGRVGRVEVFVDRISGWQLPGGDPAQDAAGQAGVAAAELPDGPLLGDVLVPGEGVAAVRPEDPGECGGDRIVRSHREYVRGRALEHRDVTRGRRHGRDDRDRGGAAADHDDPSAGVVQSVRPLLGVHDRPGEPVASGEFGGVPLVVAVVPAGREDPVGGDGPALPVVVHVEGPAGVGA